jgi:hypothetical protein
MALFRSIAGPVQTALAYITTGCLMFVWAGVWTVFLLNHSPETSAVYYWDAGFALTGLSLVVIGLAVGWIGRSARHAEASQEPVAPTAADQLPAAAVAVQPVVPVPAGAGARLQTAGGPRSKVVETTP